MSGTNEAKPATKPKKTRAEIRQGRRERREEKAAKAAEKRKKAPRQFRGVGIVAGTTPRVLTAQDDMKQSIGRIRALDWKLWRDIKQWNRCTSDKPADVYDTVPEQAGFNDWSRSWWKQAVPNYPSKQKANPTLKTDKLSRRIAFARARARTKGFQVPRHA